MESLIGRTFAGSQIVELIDDAARTLVYKGYQPDENRYVAVKVLKTTAASDPAVVQSFTQYTQLAARMQHPSILLVLDSGQVNGDHYLVTPFMEYRSVAEHLSAYADLNQAQALMTAIVPGLEYIYSQGYVHGNLRPTNIILGPQWQPLLADFSIAFRQGETPTPYNSPEQVQGGIVDQRTDVYALGVMLYELLTGQAPAPGTMFTLSAKRPDLPQRIEQVILKATAQNPEQRFRTPREFLNVLQAAVSQPVAAPAPQTITQTVQVQPTRRGTNWMVIIFGGLAVVVICLCLVWAAPKVMNVINPPAGANPPGAVQPITPPQSGQPIQPPVQQPPEQQPTQEEQPIQPPEQQPPEQQPPQSGQPIQPPEQQPPQTEEPAQLPAQGGQRLPICNSVGLAGGVVLIGGTLSLKKRKRARKYPLQKNP